METTKKELQKQLNKIQKQLDNFKEKTFKNGDWVKSINKYWFEEHPTKIFRVRKISNGYLYVECDYWNNYNFSNDYIYNFIIATDKEVREALIKEAKNKVPGIGSYKMEVEDGKIRFGCITFTTSRVKALYKNMQVLGVTSITIKGIDVSLDQLKEIVDYKS